jgi:quinol monooxygenase YgiN
MIFFLAKNRVRPDMIETYEAGFRAMAAAVKASEPGCVVYEVGRHPDGPGVYKGLEVYRDETAVLAHIDGAARGFLPILYDCFEREPEIEFYNQMV